MSTQINYKNSVLTTIPYGQSRTLTTSGTWLEDDINISVDNLNLQSKTATPTTSSQIITPDSYPLVVKVNSGTTATLSGSQKILNLGVSPSRGYKYHIKGNFTIGSDDFIVDTWYTYQQAGSVIPQIPYIYNGTGEITKFCWSGTSLIWTGQGIISPTITTTSDLVITLYADYTSVYNVSKTTVRSNTVNVSVNLSSLISNGDLIVFSAGVTSTEYGSQTAHHYNFINDEFVWDGSNQSGSVDYFSYTITSSGYTISALDSDDSSMTYEVNILKYVPYSNYDGLSQVTVSGDTNLVASNIASGVSIFGVVGTYDPSPNLQSITINTKNLLSQNTTFDTPDLVLYQDDNFNKNVNIGISVPHYEWFKSFIPINRNDEIHLYMVLSLLCNDIDETITVDCDYTVSSSITYLTFTSSSQNSNINNFSVYYDTGVNNIRFGFSMKNGNSMSAQISGQIIVTKIVDGIGTVALNLSDDPRYLNIYKSLAYRSQIKATDPGVSGWCNSLSSIYSFQFAGQPLSGDFIFSNVTKVGQYAFTATYINGFTGQLGPYNLTFPALLSFSENAPFGNNRGLISINCPILQSISPYTFTSCASLSYLSFPSCTYISNYAFQSCSRLVSISFPLCEIIGTAAFYGCSNLLTVDFPLCTSIYNYAFYNCSQLININISKCGLISSYAFTSCKNLSTINFPSCTYISNYAFQSCTSLENINFPLCSIISSYAFNNCTKLVSVSFPSCTNIGTYAFSNCSSLNTVNFPLCENIDMSAFHNCSNLVNLNFPICININSSAFYSCNSLNNINFPLCEIIGNSAFTSCKNLAIISFPKCISIGTFAFYNCNKLESAYFMGSSIASLGTNIFYSTPITNSTYLGYFGSIYVPTSLLASYKTATNWTTYSSRMVGI